MRNGRLSVRPSVCPVDLQQQRRTAALPQPGLRTAAVSGQRQCCDPRRIDADWYYMRLLFAGGRLKSSAQRQTVTEHARSTDS